jgi:hypothetical protein
MMINRGVRVFLLKCSDSDNFSRLNKKSCDNVRNEAAYVRRRIFL